MNYKEFVKTKWNKDNLFPDCTSGQEAMDILADYIMECSKQIFKNIKSSKYFHTFYIF